MSRFRGSHTKLDVMVVDLETGECVGRPYLTTLIDLATRMPTGIFLSMDASWPEQWGTQTHLIVAHEVTTVGNDRTQLAPMAKAAKAVLKLDKLEAIADRGYFNGSQILTCDQVRITATVPRPETSGNRKKGMFVKADFAYNAETDVYICPAGKHLTYRYTREEGGLMQRRYWQNECQRCPLQPHCTTGKERRITRWEHEHLINEAAARMERDPDLMRTRR